MNNTMSKLNLTIENYNIKKQMEIMNKKLRGGSSMVWKTLNITK